MSFGLSGVLAKAPCLRATQVLEPAPHLAVIISHLAKLARYYGEPAQSPHSNKFKPDPKVPSLLSINCAASAFFEPLPLNISGSSNQKQDFCHFPGCR